MTKQFLLEAIKHEQTIVMRFINLNKQHDFADGWALDYALETSVSAYRDLRDDRIDMLTAFDYYKQVTRITCECDNALVIYREDQRQQRVRQFMNDTLRDWWNRGLIAKDDDGYWDWTPGGREKVFGTAA